jgi:hypothetical protein
VRRIILVFALAALLVLVVAVPAFAGAEVVPKECGTFTDPSVTTEFCNHSVTTPSGNRNNHSTVEDEFANGETFRTKESFHAKPPR